MMKKLFAVLLTIVLLSITTAVQASVIDLTNGLYEISYEYNLKRGTLHGSDVTDIFILETDGTQVNIDYAFSAPAKGPSSISHQISFEPTLALILGLDLAPTNSGLKDHLIVFMDPDFAADALTESKFSDVFMAVGGRDRVKHSGLVQAIKDARGGDSDALQIVSNFFTEDAGKFAAFDPTSSFRVIEFSPPVPIDVVPEPTTMMLFGLGFLGLAGVNRRKK